MLNDGDTFEDYINVTSNNNWKAPMKSNAVLD